MKKIAILFSMLFMFGCSSNGFTEFYTTQITTEEILASPNYLTTCETPRVKKIATLDDLDDALLNAFSGGFVLLGYSSWNGSANEGTNEAFEQGQNVGACFVLWTSVYTNTIHGTKTVRTQNPDTTSTTIREVTSSSDPSTTYRTSSTTINSGTVTTESVPYSRSLYDYMGIFFANLINDPYTLGIMTEEVPISYMLATDSRNGVLVKAVRVDSNAYTANIFPSDIIVSINGINCNNDSDLDSFLKRGTSNELLIYRDGKTITKQIQIPK